MEPRRDDGDDDDLRVRLRQAHAAAMEPRRDDGDDPGTGTSDDIPIWASPQWSPVVTTGTTR